MSLLISLDAPALNRRYIILLPRTFQIRRNILVNLASTLVFLPQRYESAKAKVSGFFSKWEITTSLVMEFIRSIKISDDLGQKNVEDEEYCEE